MSTQNFIVVKAKIVLKTSEEGGRQSSLYSGYRPNHVFELADSANRLTSYAGDIQFDEQEKIDPGEIKNVTVRFLKNQQLEKYINIGQKWLINEGANTIGFGEILEIISS
jgi:translation elongation factor EF-Tu-like GTPase